MPCRRKHLLCPGLGRDCSICHPLGAGLGDPVTRGAACRARGSEVCVMKLSSQGRTLGTGCVCGGVLVGTAGAVWAEKSGKKRNKRDAGPQRSWYPFNPGPWPGAGAKSDGKTAPWASLCSGELQKLWGCCGTHTFSPEQGTARETN